MAYHILRNVQQPRITQGDELVYFTQSVINIEKQLFQINEEHNNGSEVCTTKTPPESIAYHTPEMRQVGLDGNILTLSESRISGNEQAGKGVESVRCEVHSRGRRPGFVSGEPPYESAVLPQEMPEHTGMPQGHMSESRDSIIWRPSPQTSPSSEDCNSAGCAITLSRIYFANATKKSDQLHTCEYDYDVEKFENFNLPPNNNITDRQKNWYKDKTLRSTRRQSAPASSSTTTPSKTSSMLGGMFPNAQPSGAPRKQANKRSLSETGEYVYFLSDSRKPNSFSRDAICSRPWVDCNEYFPPEKHSKNQQERPETIVIPDEYDMEQRANNEETLMQVITDSEGRIRVNVVNSPTKDRQQHVEVTQPSEHYHGCLEENLGELPDSKDFLKINECTSDPINFENQNPELCIPTSALIPKEWNAWKKANCVPLDEYYYTGHCCDCRTGQFCERHLQRYVVDENNNHHYSVADTPLVNKIIQTSRQRFPDNEIIEHEGLAKQNFKCRHPTTQIARCTRRLDFPKDNCSENDQPMFGQRCSCIEDTRNMHCHETRGITGQYAHVGSRHHARVSDCQTPRQDSYENKTSRGSVKALKEDAGCKCKKCLVKSRQETTMMKETRKEPTMMRKNTVQHFCSTSKNQDTKDTTNETLPVEALKGKESSGSKEVASQSEAEDSNGDTIKESVEFEAKSRYQCDWPACDKSFRHYSFLVLHKRIHTGERPYVCSWQGCSKQFRRSDDYQRHYRVHTGVKPYVCMLCSKRFKRSDHRLFHYRAIHHVENVGKTKRKRLH